MSNTRQVLFYLFFPVRRKKTPQYQNCCQVHWRKKKYLFLSFKYYVLLAWAHLVAARVRKNLLLIQLRNNDSPLACHSERSLLRLECLKLHMSAHFTRLEKLQKGARVTEVLENTEMLDPSLWSLCGGVDLTPPCMRTGIQLTLWFGDESKLLIFWVESKYSAYLPTPCLVNITLQPFSTAHAHLDPSPQHSLPPTVCFYISVHFFHAWNFSCRTMVFRIVL